MRKTQAGQMMILAVLLLFTLIIVIPIMVSVSRTGTLQHIFSLKKNKGRLIAEEGVALAVQQLSKPGVPPPNWPYLGGTLPGSGIVASPEGATYALAYASYTAVASAFPLAPKQVGILVRALDANGQVLGASSIHAVVSQRTTGVRLPTGYTAPAALELDSVPSEGTNALLRVEWGPMVQRDNNQWNLDAYNQNIRRPRKFAAGGLSPRNTLPVGRTSDHKEYWTFISPGFQMVIDRSAYIALAQASTCTTPPTGCTPSSGCNSQAGTNCYFSNVNTSTAIFDTSFTVNAGGVVYINGSAEFQNVNLGAAGAVIVTRSLTLGTNGQPPSGVTPTTLPMPPTVMLDDPYCTCCDPLCLGVVDRHIDLKGFVYAMGDATVAKDSNWTVHGAVRVDGLLSLADNSTLYVFFDHATNQSIRTANFELQIDSMTAVP